MRGAGGDGPAGRKRVGARVVLLLDQVEMARRDSGHEVVEEPRHHLPAEAAAEPPPTAWRLDSSTEKHRHIGLLAPGIGTAHDVFARFVLVPCCSLLVSVVRWCVLVSAGVRGVPACPAVSQGADSGRWVG